MTDNDNETKRLPYGLLKSKSRKDSVHRESPQFMFHKTDALFITAPTKLLTFSLPRFIMPIESGLFSTKQPVQGFGTSSLPGVLPLVAPGLFSHIPAIEQSRMVLRPVTGRLTLTVRLPILPFGSAIKIKRNMCVFADVHKK
jgi:hypothetical protein